ncbi:MAG: serine/threonine-protein kinase [Gemmatimonas sp.]
MTLGPRTIGHLQSLVRNGEPSAGPSDRYTLHEIIGQGAMGTVHRAHDTVLGRDVAFKLLDRRDQSTRTRERFERESLILAGLEHPGIVPVYDAGEMSDGTRFHVMQLVRGQRLDAYVQRGLSRGEVLRLMLRLAETVAFANARGVVHRDLKPGNVMVGPFGEVLVLDWGVAKVLHDAPRHDENQRETTAGLDVAVFDATRDGAVIGTPGYMAPEQQSGASGAVDQRADVYALGVIMRELLATTPDGSTRSLRAIADRASHTDVYHRYATARDFADDIRRWLDGAPVHAHKESLMERTIRICRQHQTAILLVLTYLFVRITILLWRNI